MDENEVMQMTNEMDCMQDRNRRTSVHKGVGPVKATGAVLMLLLAVLSGCFGAAEDLQPDDPTQDDPPETEDRPIPDPETAVVSQLEAELDPIPADEEEESDWFVMSMAAGPDQPLQAFDWTLPDGSVLVSDNGYESVVLEFLVLPAGDDYETLDRILLGGFAEGSDAEGNDGAVSLNWLSLEPWHEIFRVDTEEQSASYGAAWPSAHLWWPSPPMGDGDPVYFVLGAAASQPINLTVVFRPLPEQPEEDPPQTLAAFQAEVSNDRPKALGRLGSGAGFIDPWYMDINYVGADPGGWGVYGAWEGWNDDVDVEQESHGDLRPYAAVREVTTSYDYPGDEGWSIGIGLYLANLATGVWEADVDFHGSTLSASGVLTGDLPGWAVEPYWDYAGYHGYYVEGGGEGPGSAMFRVEEAAVTGVYEMIIFFHVEYGATLEQLIGIPAIHWQEVWPLESPTAQTLHADQVACAQMLQRSTLRSADSGTTTDGAHGDDPIEQSASRLCGGLGHG